MFEMHLQPVNAVIPAHGSTKPFGLEFRNMVVALEQVQGDEGVLVVEGMAIHILNAQSVLDDMSLGFEEGAES